MPGFEPPTLKGNFNLSGIENDQFFHEAEERILLALREFADSATGSEMTRRKLFAQDAAQGIALVELLRVRFDVVLMNPPFGEPIPATRRYVDKNYPSGKNDLYTSFVLAAASRINSSHGRIGALTSRAFLTGRDQRHFRKQILGDGLRNLNLMVDLGMEY